MEHQRHYVGIDLHRRRSVIVRRNEAGEALETVRIDNDPIALAAEIAKAGEHPDVVLEAIPQPRPKLAFVVKGGLEEEGAE